MQENILIGLIAACALLSNAALAPHRATGGWGRFEPTGD